MCKERNSVMFYLQWPEKPTAFLEVCFYAFYDCPEIYLFVRNDAPERKTGCFKQQDLTKVKNFPDKRLIDFFSSSK